MIQFNFEGIGTKWQIEIYQELSVEEKNKLLFEIRKRIEIFDKNYSRFREDSLLMQMSRKAGTFTMPPDAEPMLKLYYDLYKITNGFFTPLVGDILSDAGYDAKYSLKQKRELKVAPVWEEVIEYKHPDIKIKKPAILDFGAGGKGYLIDLVAQVLEDNNVGQYCVDAGGDILYKGITPIQVGLEDPENTEKVVGVYTLGEGSICGSAGHRRAWGNFTHIINPKTLASPTDIIAVWVAADTALLADALTTCLFFVPAARLSEAYKFEYALVREDHSIEKSANWKGKMFVVK